MEALLIRSSSSPFSYGAADIHAHFAGRTVNQQLRYYQKLMDQRRRGVAISALVDDQDRSGQASSSNVSEPSSAGLSPSPATSAARDVRTLPSLNIGPGSASPTTASSGSDSQRPLPSFSTIDLNAGGGSKLHDEILARHSNIRSARSPTSARSAEDQYGSRERALLRQGIAESARSEPRREQPQYSPSRAPGEPSFYVNPSGEPYRAGPPPELTSPPTYADSGREDFPDRASTFARLSPTQTSSTESIRPLSDILEKTHAQINLQRPQTESPVERSGFAPGPSSHQTPTLPIHPNRGSYFPPTLRSDPQLPPHHPTSPAQITSLQHHSPPQALYARPATAYQGHAPSAVPQQLQAVAAVPPSPLDAASSSSAGGGVGARKRRGNLPRDAVRLFKKWVEENKKHPYPNEAQKQEFERATGLSMQQINNWFINARRRNLTPKEREDMRREKERAQSQSGSPASSRPDEGQDLPDAAADDFSLAGPSRAAQGGHHARDHSMGGS